MKISKQNILKILKDENLTDEQKSELMILMRENSDLLTDLLADKMTTKEKTSPKEKTKNAPKKSTKKGKTSKNGQVRDFVNSLRKGERFGIDDVVKGTGLDRTSARNSLYTLYRNEEVQSDQVGIYFR